MRTPKKPQTPASPHCTETEELASFRHQVKRFRETNTHGWESTKKLVGSPHLASTLAKLIERIRQSAISSSLQEVLIQGLGQGRSQRLQDLDAPILKAATGLPTTKAVRALCLWFQLINDSSPTEQGLRWTPADVEEALRTSPNPYDLLLHAPHPSLLDMGAGDLSFEQELTEQYLPHFREKGTPLTLHAIDRLHPDSQFGGVYHANRERLLDLNAHPSTELRWRFWGGVDMFTLPNVKGLLPWYTITTCHAPATPTFALEPSRLSRETITAHLKKAKGAFRKVRLQGEEALEVNHEGRVLTFPSWKFEIHGPLALLDLLAHRGQLCILTGVDSEVFWEILAQLLQDESYRPPNVLFSPDVLPSIFGGLHRDLEHVPVGERIRLSDLATLRQDIPHVMKGGTSDGRCYRFSYVEIRRGAVFEGIPGSFTARQFTHMREESPPWWLILIPEIRNNGSSQRGS